MYASSTEESRVSSFTANHTITMSEQELTLCEFQDCKQPNPRIEIDRIRRETNFLKTKGDESHQDLFASIKELKAMPASLDQVFVQAEIEAALKERLRALQTRMTVVW